MSDNDLFKLIFMDFLTNPQEYTLGSASFFDFALFICNEINKDGGYFAYYDKIADQISISASKSDADLILKIQFLEKRKFQLMTSEEQDDFLRDNDFQLKMGKAAMLIMNATTAWETEQLPKYLSESFEDEQINLFLSKTTVAITKEEKTVIENILQRMAESNNYYYNYCKNVAFELELRATYPHGAPKKSTEQEEEDSSSDDFEWL